LIIFALMTYERIFEEMSTFNLGENEFGKKK
jgi:hypothetical protein